MIRPMPLAPRTGRALSQDGDRLDVAGNPHEIPPAARDVKDQHLFGDSLLVAPIAPGAKTRKVLLPAGRWYHFCAGSLAGCSETIAVAPPLSRMPLSVKDGSLIPMLAGERQWAPSTGEAVVLEVHHFGALPGRLLLYDDDGETFDFERGSYSWTELAVDRDATGV